MTESEGHLGFGETSPAEPDKATRVWWHFDALYEKWKKLMTETESKVQKAKDEPRAGRNTAVSKNRISIRVDANALSIIALMTAVAAMTLYISQSQVVDAKIQAGTSKAEAEANEAKVNSRVAIDKVRNIKVQLAAKGIVIHDD